jgi:transposase-like protein
MNAVVDTSLTGRRRNRSWPEALKREIVGASLAPGASVSIVARQYQVNANQVFQWRKLYRNDPPPGAAGTAPRLVPVAIVADPHDGVAPLGCCTDMIEIEVRRVYRVRVGSAVDSTALRRVLDVLERR